MQRPTNLEYFDGVSAGDEQTWRPLLPFDLYRFLLCSLMLTLYFAGAGPKLLGQDHPQLFQVVILAYFGFSIISLLLNRYRKFGFQPQVLLRALVDILAITLIMHSSGGLISGLGMLLIVALAGASLLAAGRMAILLAAIATLAVLAEQVYAHIYNMFQNTAYAQAGLLGATFFATAILAHGLSVRIRHTEAIARQKSMDLANMERLNAYIIQQMQTGVLVVDDQAQVRLINGSARNLLNVPLATDACMIADISSELASQWRQWSRDPTFKARQFRLSATCTELAPRFIRIGQSRDLGTLIFLEDASETSRRAQELKLAALGRLTASIAHEVRNPLGAISHAGQLLSESSQLPPADQRLIRIILNHSKRMNEMVENVLQLSRREASHPQLIPLKAWLATFGDELVAIEKLTREDIRYSIEPDTIQVLMDPNHLHQVVTNLCDNALRHGSNTPGRPRLELVAHLSSDIQAVFLDIVDYGPCIEPVIVESIFEPFFSTAREGTGLGLYLAREICESNQCSLDYFSLSTPGNCFRITFAHPSRTLT